MNLYHGSLELITKPEIRQPNRTLDYGSGCYATTSQAQAEDWVRRKMKEAAKTQGYVNEYSLDEDALAGMRCLYFNLPTEEWLDFVMRNRTDRNFVHDYDVVYGPVANDKVYAAFALYEGGLLDRHSLIAELKAYKLVDQYLFHTEKALKAIKFIDAKTIKL